MFKRPIFAVLLGLTVLLPASVRAADEKAPKNDKPAVFLRFAALDHLRSDFRYLGEVVGEGEKAKQLDEFLKSKLGEKGLEGIDAKKPIGAYGWVGEAGIDSKAVVLVPVAKEKSFIDLLSDTLDAKPDKGDDGVYTMKLENLPFPVYFRFANGYAYVTVRDKEVLDKDKLLTPEAVLPGAGVGTASLTVNIDEIPDNLKENALLVIENQLANIKDQDMHSHSEAQKKFHGAVVDELGAQLKSLFKNGAATTLRLDLDRKDGDLALTLSTAGKPGSPLANKIRDLGQVKSLTAGLLHPNSAFALELNVSLPEKLRVLLGPALQDTEKQLLAKAKDESRREALKALLDGIMPTLKAAELDAAIDLRGPSKKGGYTLVGGIKIKDQAKLQQSFRKASALLPNDLKLSTPADAEKADQIRFPRLSSDKELKNDAQRSLGENPGILVFRDNLLLLGAGEKGDNALKEALKAAPATGNVMQLQIALSRLVQLFEDDPTQVAIARKVFGDGKDNDRLRLTVEGGSTLTLRLALKAKLIDFVNRVDKAKKE